MRRSRIGEVLRLERRSTMIDPFAEYTLIGVYSFGKGIFHREPRPGLELGDYRFFSIEPGDLVLSNIQAWEGAIAHATERDRGCVGTHRFLSYVPREDGVDTNYLRYYFLGEQGHGLIRRASPGSVTRNRTLSIDRFEDLVIPLPDIVEQRRIVERLENCSLRIQALGERIAGAKRGIAALPEVLASGLIRATASSMERLGGYATVMRGKGPEYDPESEQAVVNQACVRWGGLDLGRVKRASLAWTDSLPERFRISVGDVLVNSTGEGTIGRACVAHEQAVGLPFDSHVLVVRTKRNELDPEFLALFLQSADGQASINNAKSATTTKQTELGKAKLEDLLVPVPDIERQRATVSRARSVLGFAEEVAQRRDMAARKTSALWAATLNRAFTGVT